MAIRQLPTAKDLATAAEAALGRDVLRPKLTPVLPADWPDAGGSVVYYVYRSDSLPSGRVRFRLTGPTHRVEFAALTVKPTVHTYPEPKALGEEEREHLTDEIKQNLEKAQQTLIEIIAGDRPDEQSRAELQPYLVWLERNPRVAGDVETRSAAFVAWLREHKEDSKRVQ